MSRMLASDLGAELSSYADRIDLDGERLAAVQLRRSALRDPHRETSAVTWRRPWPGWAQASERLLAVDTAADDLAQARREERSRAARRRTRRILSAARAEAATELATG
jgi:DNA repair ATPase RecN